ncbi:MAG: glycosyltransferase family 39 protein, partial [Candidatus Diapherotrites archaeon]|nr:glycosyltransferase family 39 protein [Candidatus Diapherotrites archaeon]
HYILVVFGSYYFVKLFSVLCGLASILLCYKSAELLFNKRTALLSAFLLALNPLHLFYSQHTRAHAMVIFLFSLFIYVLLRFLNEPKRKEKVIMLASVATVMLYTHYVSLIIMVCGACFVLYRVRRKGHGLFILLPFFVAALLFLPQAYVLVTHPALAKNNIYERSILDVPYIFYKFGNGANISFLLNDKAFLLYPAFLVNILFALGLFKLFKEKKASELFLFFFLLPFPLIALVTIKVTHFFYFRNFTYLLPLFVLPIAYYTANLKSRYLKLALLALIVLGWLTIIALYYSVVTMPDWNVYIGL